MSLIILTCQDDLHADAVIRQLGDERPDFNVIRINTDNLPVNLDFSFHWNNAGNLETRCFKVHDSQASTTTASVIWYRKPDQPPPHPALKDFNAKQCSVQEQKELLRSISGLFPNAVWVNDYWQMQRYSIKANQIATAKKIGLSIPETIISNSLKEVKTLASRHDQIIVKPLAYNGFAVTKSQFGCFTSTLTKAEIELLDEQVFALAPAIFQQRIHKVQELRITIVGEQVFACEIQTKQGTKENVDWRIECVEELPHRIVEIPTDFSDRLKKMLKLMNLNFGAFDVIKDDSGTYFFIEVNPNGQYFWIELLTGSPITHAVVSLILRLSDSNNAG